MLMSRSPQKGLSTCQSSFSAFWPAEHGDSNPLRARALTNRLNGINLGKMKLFKPGVAQLALFWLNGMPSIFTATVLKTFQRRVCPHPKALNRLGVRIIADSSHGDSQFVEQEKVFQALLLLEKADGQLFRRVMRRLSTIHVRTEGPSSRVLRGGCAVVNLTDIPKGISHPAAIAGALVSMATRVMFAKRRFLKRGGAGKRINRICRRTGMRAFARMASLYRNPGPALQSSSSTSEFSSIFFDQSSSIIHSCANCKLLVRARIFE